MRSGRCLWVHLATRRVARLERLLLLRGWPVSEGKDPRAIDAKLLGRYDVHISNWAKASPKQAGGADLQNLRHGSLFVLLSTHGQHPLFAEEGDRTRDVRRVALKAFGYSVSFKGGHVRVRIERKELKRLKAHFVGLAVHRKAESIAAEFLRLPFEPYATVRRQLPELLRLVSRARRTAGLDPVPVECLRLRRRIVRSFDGVDGAREAA